MCYVPCSLSPGIVCSSWILAFIQVDVYCKSPSLQLFSYGTEKARFLQPYLEARNFFPSEPKNFAHSIGAIFQRNYRGNLSPLKNCTCKKTSSAYSNTIFLASPLEKADLIFYLYCQRNIPSSLFQDHTCLSLCLLGSILDFVGWPTKKFYWIFRYIIRTPHLTYLEICPANHWYCQFTLQIFLGLRNLLMLVVFRWNKNKISVMPLSLLHFYKKWTKNKK